LRKVPEVEEARAVMTEAMAWSVFTWLLRKSEVRATADRANAAVDRLKRATRSRWSSEIRLAYKETEAKGSPYSSVASALEAIDPENTNSYPQTAGRRKGGSRREGMPDRRLTKRKNN